jgi:cytochrome c-type biogenesis protein CcmH
MSPVDHADTRAGRRGGTPPRPDETGVETPPTAVTATTSKRAFAAVLAVVLLLLVSFVAPAQGATPRTTLEAVEAELMCVTCKTPLNQSNAPQAIEEREAIEDLVAQGKTKDEAVDAMVAIYGTPVLIDPPEGSLRAARIAVPAGAALIGIALLVVLVRRWRRRGRLEDDEAPAPGGAPDLESSSPAMTDDDRRRLDADLKRYA